MMLTHKINKRRTNRQEDDRVLSKLGVALGLSVSGCDVGLGVSGCDVGMGVYVFRCMLT